METVVSLRPKWLQSGISIFRCKDFSKSPRLPCIVIQPTNYMNQNLVPSLLWINLRQFQKYVYRSEPCFVFAFIDTKTPGLHSTKPTHVSEPAVFKKQHLLSFDDICDQRCHLFTLEPAGAFIMSLRLLCFWRAVHVYFATSFVCTVQECRQPRLERKWFSQ